jgi:hypothetical protein
LFLDRILAMGDSGADWNVNGNSAQLICGLLRGAVTIDAYQARFRAERWDDRRIDGLAVLGYVSPHVDTTPLKLLESHARGGDFVATFAELGEDRVAPQLYWRASAVKPLAASKLELMISVKTDLLDSKPVCYSSSSLSGDAIVLHTASLDDARFDVLETRPTRHGDATVWRPPIEFPDSQSRQHLFVFRFKEQNLSFAQMVHPSDFVSAQLHADMQLNHCLSSTLFPEHLEKGVIRRGRICGWFMPAENDLDMAVALARQFVEEPLPLTA